MLLCATDITINYLWINNKNQEELKKYEFVTLY